MAFEKFYITDKGAALLAKAQIGDPLTFTRAAAGDGVLGTQKPTALTDLIHRVADLTVSALSFSTPNIASVQINFSNKDIQEPFTWGEIGLFAKGADNIEILYAYGSAGDNPDQIPSYGTAPTEFVFLMNTTVGDASNVTAVISTDLVYATHQDIEDIKDGTITVNHAATADAASGYTKDGDIAKNFKQTSSHMSDDIIHTSYVVSTNSGNDYSVTTTLSPTAYTDGMSVCVKFNIASTGAATLNVNGLGKKALYDNSGATIADIKANDQRTFRYESVSGNFVQQGGTSNSPALTAHINNTLLHKQGTGCTQTGQYANAEGYQTSASMFYAHAEGQNTNAQQQASHAEGASTTASGMYAHAEGEGSTASGEASKAEGKSTTASGMYAHAEGESTIAAGQASHAEGGFTVACVGTIFYTRTYNINAKTITLDNTTGLSVGCAVTIRTYNANDVSGTITAISGNVITLNIPSWANAADWRTLYVIDSTKSARSHSEGYCTIAIGQASHAEGSNVEATGYAAHAEGYYTYAFGQNSHAEGEGTTASGQDSHAEGDATTANNGQTHAEGMGTTAAGQGSHVEGTGSKTTVNGCFAHAEGNYTTASAFYSHAEGNCTTANAYISHVMGSYNKPLNGSYNSFSNASDAFVIGNGQSSSSLGNAFRVTFQGYTYGYGAFNSAGADYAEYFEWADGNSNNDDRVGYFVTLDGEKIRKATSQDADILGIVSATPSVIGDSHQDDWNNKYVTDDWGRIQYHNVDVAAVTDKDGKIIAPAHTDTVPQLNPNWDNTKEYVPREKRPEWSPVGMMGKLLVRDDGTCKVNGYCRPNDSGIATNSDTGYRVMARITPSIIKILLRNTAEAIQCTPQNSGTRLGRLLHLIK